MHDPTVIAVGHQQAGFVFIDLLYTFQGSREQPVQLSDVEAKVVELYQRFRRVREIRVESWQGLSAVQRLRMRGLPVQLFTPTAKTNAEEWPVLAQRLSAGTLVLPAHARLREELLNLLVEIGPQGVKVIDRGKVHQDHAVAVRGVVAQFQPRARQQAIATISVDEMERIQRQTPVRLRDEMERCRQADRRREAEGTQDAFLISSDVRAFARALDDYGRPGRR